MHYKPFFLYQSIINNCDGRNPTIFISIFKRFDPIFFNILVLVFRYMTRVHYLLVSGYIIEFYIVFDLTAWSLTFLPIFRYFHQLLFRHGMSVQQIIFLVTIRCSNVCDIGAGWKRHSRVDIPWILAA